MQNIEHETYETIPEVFGSEGVPSLSHSTPPQPVSRKMSSQQQVDNISASLPLSGIPSVPSRFNEREDAAFTSSLDPGTRPPYPTPSPLSKKPLRTTYSHSDVNSTQISARPPCPMPQPQPTTPHTTKPLAHSHSTTCSEVSSSIL